MRRLAILLWTMIAFVVPAFAQAAPAAPEPFLPVSVWYSGGKARAPMLSALDATSPENWRSDLKTIKELGFNTVRTWVEWAHGEPQEGEFHFENLQLLCRLAQEVGLRVIVQVYADSAPDWVGLKYPDAQFEAQSGAKVKSQAAPGYCSDHPQVGERIQRFYSEAARIANQFPNLWAWDLWSEPHIINWAEINYVPNAQFCFCPHTRARFRYWLDKRYGSLDALNAAWYRNFGDWREVEPPRFGTLLSYTDLIDWKTFIYEKLAQDLRMRYEAIRRVDSTHTITSHAAVPSIFTTPFAGDGASDDFMMADQLDYYGMSLYPKHSFPQRHWPRWQINVATDFTRSANLQHGGFYIGELQAGFGVHGVVVGDPVTPEDQRLWLWTVIAKGAKAVNFYAYYPMSSGYESGGYGLIELDGTVTKRAEEAGKAARIIHENRELILASKPEPAQVAILYNPLSQMVGGEQGSGPIGGFRDSLIGYHRVFNEANVPVDFVHRKALEGGLPPQYRLLILPYPIMFTPKAAEAVRTFVDGGGHVLSEARLAWNDASGAAMPVIPGMGLAEVFGVREDHVKMSESVAIRVTKESHVATAGLQGKTLKGAYFAATWRPLEGTRPRVLGTLEDGSPTLVSNRFGNGETLLVGSFLGMGTHPSADTNNRAFILNLLKWAGVESMIATDPSAGESVEAVVRIGPNSALLFLLNPMKEARAARLSLRCGRDGVLNAHELLSGQTRRLTAHSGRIVIEEELAAQAVAVWEIQEYAP